MVERSDPDAEVASGPLFSATTPLLSAEVAERSGPDAEVAERSGPDADDVAERSGPDVEVAADPWADHDILLNGEWRYHIVYLCLHVLLNSYLHMMCQQRSGLMKLLI